MIVVPNSTVNTKVGTGNLWILWNDMTNVKQVIDMSKETQMERLNEIHVWFPLFSPQWHFYTDKSGDY